MLHIHVGPGSLGLGLVVWSGVLAGFDVQLISRPPTDGGDLPALELRVHGEEPQDFDALNHSAAIRLADLRPGTEAALDAADNVLITTAVKTAGIATFAPLIVELAEKVTRRGAHVTFMACENDRGEAYPELAAQLEHLGVDCRLCMVNRVCFQPRVAQRPGRRVVSAHRPLEWVIEGAADSVTLEHLDELEHVSFVDDVEPYELRKRWMINGAHLAMAVSAWAQNEPILSTILTPATLEERLSRLHNAFAIVLTENYPVLGDCTIYPQRFIDAWVDSKPDDSTIRVISRYKRADLAAFFADFERKFCEPVRAASAHDPAVLDIARDVLKAMHTLLVRRLTFLDFDEMRHGVAVLTADKDEQALKQYAQTMAGIVSPQEIALRLSELEETLASQRHQYPHAPQGEAP